MKLNKLFIFSSLSLISFSLLNANAFHYYDFKKRLEKKRTIENKNCFLCPKEIRESVTKQTTYMVNGREYDLKTDFLLKKKVSKIKLRYGRDIKYKNYETILEESRAKNSIVLAGINYSPYTSVINNDKFNNIDSTIVHNPPTITEHNELTYSFNFITLFPTNYFGFHEDTPSIYLETKISSQIDVILNKDLLNGRIGSFYGFIGAGLRLNFEQSSTDGFIKPLVSGKFGYMFTKQASIWLGVILRDKMILDDKLEDIYYQDYYEANLNFGWRF